MIAFGSCVGSKDQLERLLLPGIARSIAGERCEIFLEGEPGKNTSIFSIYNRVLSRARAHANLEALVLLHTDVELRDPMFLPRVRQAMRIPEVGVVGTVGGRCLRSIGWWTATGGFKGYAEDTINGVYDWGFDGIDVDVVDGLMLVLSPRAIGSLRFDEENFTGFHGYDADVCSQARHLGMRVVVQRFDFLHHAKREFTGGAASYERSNAVFRKKWMAPAPSSVPSPPVSRSTEPTAGRTAPPSTTSSPSRPRAPARKASVSVPSASSKHQDHVRRQQLRVAAKLVAPAARRAKSSWKRT